MMTVILTELPTEEWKWLIELLKEERNFTVEEKDSKKETKNCQLTLDWDCPHFLAHIQRWLGHYVGD